MEDFRTRVKQKQPLIFINLGDYIHVDTIYCVPLHSIRFSGLAKRVLAVIIYHGVPCNGGIA